MKKESKRLKTVVIIVLPVVVVVVLVVLIVSMLVFLRARKQKDGIASLQVDDSADLETLAFDISTIRTATDDFSDENYIGRVEYGAGSLVNEQVIAVKRLDHHCMEGDSEFKNQVLLLAKLQHPNLVRSIERSRFGQGTRYKIIGDIVRGLVYLRQDSQIKVVYQDLKATNILLDPEMNPKISEFCMVKMFRPRALRNTSQGYMTPEYAIAGAFSNKSNMFQCGSFGDCDRHGETRGQEQH
ncbi:cysteine-rich receptor-like protein kinase 29 [Benincasa hispida]|uniref:cysteine-rich receptor-like protein kinase 29 n=1 Tax=Benincasa hispida TaxID=102211 RepID=UPI001902BFBF|nr:cysteine-rich receptor-like protein kinase 29 [Benincasa hispida]